MKLEPPPGDDTNFDDFVDDLLAERSPRSLVIISAARIDTLLQEILAKFLLPKIAKAKDPDELLEGDVPLATFSSRIKVCYRLGLIDSTLYKTLERLRSIRNLSAHEVCFQLGESPLREHLSELSKLIIHRESFKLTQKRYFDSTLTLPQELLQCQLLTVCVLLEAIRETVSPTTGDLKLLAIAIK